MTTTVVPGYLGTITIDSKDLTVVGNVFSISGSSQELSKPVFGSAYRKTAKGQTTWTLSCEGWIGAEKMADLDAIFRSATPVTAEVQIGSDSDATDAGKYSGQLAVLEWSFDQNADGQVDWSLSGTFDGDAAYTAPTP